MSSIVAPASRRQQEQEQLQIMRINNREPGMQALRRYLEGQLADLPSRVQQCLPADFSAMQAETKFMNKLLHEITKPITDRG